MSHPLTPAARRSALIGALRHPETWPPGFEWNFFNCHTCAIGLMHRLMPGAINWGLPARLTYTAVKDEAESIGAVLGIPAKDAIYLFADVNSYGEYTEITPQMVADKLEEVHMELCEKEKADVS